jgi:hypothetical protein
MMLLRRKEVVQTHKKRFANSSQISSDNTCLRVALLQYLIYVVVDYLTPLSVAHTRYVDMLIQNCIIGRAVNHELEVLCKEEFVE